MILFSLDKKLHKLQYNLDANTIKDFTVSNKMDDTEVIGEIQKELSLKLLRGIVGTSNSTIDVLTTTVDNVTTFTASTYVLSERQMLETILECLDMEDCMRRKMIAEIKSKLGIGR